MVDKLTIIIPTKTQREIRIRLRKLRVYRECGRKPRRSRKPKQP